MPVILLCAFLIASAGLASIVLVVLTAARRPSRSIAAFLCLVIASWLLALDLALSNFSWQTGASLHVWFRHFSSFAIRAELVLVPLSLCLFTAPFRRDRPVKAGRWIPFALSLVATGSALIIALAIVPALTRSALANTDAVWIASFSFIALVAVAEIAFDRARLKREGTFPFAAAAGTLAPIFTIAPFAFRYLTLNDDVIALAISALVSLAAIVAMPLIAGKETPNHRAGEGGHSSKEIKQTTGTTGGKEWTLSARETEIAALIVEGKTNAEIAVALFISQKTVETHLHNIFRKMGVTNRVQLARALLSARQ